MATAIRFVDKAYVACTVAAASVLVMVLGLDFEYYAAQSFPSFAYDLMDIPVGRDFVHT
jgi:hypothetical protein